MRIGEHATPQAVVAALRARLPPTLLADAMARYDVFNGDADGRCALQQLRLAEPVDARLVTGPKRDVALLARVAAGPGDLVTVLDVAMAVNGRRCARCSNAAPR